MASDCQSAERFCPRRKLSWMSLVCTQILNLELIRESPWLIFNDWECPVGGDFGCRQVSKRNPPWTQHHSQEPLPSSLSSRVRVIGSSTLALCHLASGAADAYYQFGLHCWDLAAATVIIREAGGIVMDTSGEPL